MQRLTAFLLLWAALGVSLALCGSPDIILQVRDTTMRQLKVGDSQDFTFNARVAPESNATFEYALTVFVIIPEDLDISNYVPFANLTGTSNGTLPDGSSINYSLNYPNNTVILPSVEFEDHFDGNVDFDFTITMINAGFNQGESYASPFNYIVYITPVEELFVDPTNTVLFKSGTIASGERRAYRLDKPVYGEQPDLVQFTQCGSTNLGDPASVAPVRAVVLWNRFSDYVGNASKNFASDTSCGAHDDATLKLADPMGLDSYAAMCPTYVDSTSDPSLSYDQVYFFIDVNQFWITRLNATVSYNFTVYADQSYIIPPLEPEPDSGSSAFIAPLTLKKKGNDLQISFTPTYSAPGSDPLTYEIYSDYLLPSATREALIHNNSLASPCFLRSLSPIAGTNIGPDGEIMTGTITNFYTQAVDMDSAGITVNVLVHNKDSVGTYQPTTVGGSSDDDSGLSGGEIAGIVIGSLIGALILLVVVVVVGLFVFRRISKKDYEDI